MALEKIECLIPSGATRDVQRGATETVVLRGIGAERQQSGHERQSLAFVPPASHAENQGLLEEKVL